MSVCNRFGDTLSPYDLSARKEMERIAGQQPRTAPRGSPYDLGYAARLDRHLKSQPKASPVRNQYDTSRIR